MRGMKEMMSCHMKMEESNEMCIFKGYNKMDKRNEGKWRDAEIRSHYFNVQKEQKVIRGGVSHPPFLRPFSAIYLFWPDKCFWCPTTS